jgi:very-short-patch-repair endonuclease
LEERFLGLIERRGLPRPRVGVRLEGFEADFLWPEARLVVETDGRDAHATREAVERDRAKDMALRRAGYDVIRLSGRQVRYEEEAIAADLVKALSRSRASSKAPSRASSSPASAR